MGSYWHRSLSFIVLFSTAAVSAYGQTQRDIKAVEIAQLPPFCWEQYLDGVSGPQYRIDRQACGPTVNHYCPGLVELIRAKASAGDARKRSYHIDKAKFQTLYTLRGIEKYPACPIRAHAQETLNQINGMSMGLGKKK
jgi:hypothetical protein